MISRGWSAFLIAVATWSWLIWPRFAVAIWNDPRSWASGVTGQGAPTSFLWIHAALILVSLVTGTAVGWLGVRGWRAGRG